MKENGFYRCLPALAGFSPSRYFCFRPRRTWVIDLLRCQRESHQAGIMGGFALIVRMSERAAVPFSRFWRFSDMDRRIVARWQDWSGKGVEHTVIRCAQESNRADGVVIGTADGQDFAVRYQIRCDGSWTLEHACIEIVGEQHKVEFMSDGRGKWTDGSGSPLPALDGAIDIDLSVSPFTNTLPIRRLQLAKGRSAEIRAVYVHFPDLAVLADPQRYTCLEPLRCYRYESLDSDFVREIEVDDNGLIVTYPGLFKRLI